MDHGWTLISLKKIMLSPLQKVHCNEESKNGDPDNKWVSGPLEFRMSGEIYGIMFWPPVGLLNREIGVSKCKTLTNLPGLWGGTTAGATGLV